MSLRSGMRWVSHKALRMGQSHQSHHKTLHDTECTARNTVRTLRNTVRTMRNTVRTMRNTVRTMRNTVPTTREKHVYHSNCAWAYRKVLQACSRSSFVRGNASPLYTLHLTLRKGWRIPPIIAQEYRSTLLRWWCIRRRGTGSVPQG